MNELNLKKQRVGAIVVRASGRNLLGADYYWMEFVALQLEKRGYLAVTAISKDDTPVVISPSEPIMKAFAARYLEYRDGRNDPFMCKLLTVMRRELQLDALNGVYPSAYTWLLRGGKHFNEIAGAIIRAALDSRGWRWHEGSRNAWMRFASTEIRYRVSPSHVEPVSQDWEKKFLR
jgi:hypothetical protein